MSGESFEGIDDDDDNNYDDDDDDEDDEDDDGGDAVRTAISVLRHARKARKAAFPFRPV